MKKAGIATIALALCFSLTASASWAWHFRPAPPPPAERSFTPYAGDCGPNPPPGYRHDLKDWRSGFNRDFYCYMLDEN